MEKKNPKLDSPTGRVRVRLGPNQQHRDRKQRIPRRRRRSSSRTQWRASSSTGTGTANGTTDGADGGPERPLRRDFCSPGPHVEPRGPAGGPLRRGRRGRGRAAASASAFPGGRVSSHSLSSTAREQRADEARGAADSSEPREVVAEQHARRVAVEEFSQGGRSPSASDVPELDEELARLGGVVGGAVDELFFEEREGGVVVERGRRREEGG